LGFLHENVVEKSFFNTLLAENSTPLWSHHSILRSDETWLPEWSGNLGEVQHGTVRSRVPSIRRQRRPK
jgi:hypothetical protein